MNKVITMCDSRYFKYGTMFLKTRFNIKADFVCYGPDLTKDQQAILEYSEIEYKRIDTVCYSTKMQYLKFKFIENEITCKNNSLITFCDWDTFFVKDWAAEICPSISMGVTYRKELILKKCYRAFSNGGVMFFRNTEQAKKMCEIALLTMSSGRNDELPEYDMIWKTLEDSNRPEHKRHFRTNLRWWCDQVFLSALAYRCVRGSDYDTINLCNHILNYQGIKIGFYDCEKFNVVESRPDETGNVFIRHLKTNSGAGKELKDGKVG